MNKKLLYAFISALSFCLLAVCLTACKEDEHEHVYDASVTAPTCTEQGYTTYTCTCGDSYIDTYVKALGHSFTKYVSNKNATCTEDGTKTATCDREGCNATDTVTDAGSKLGHKYGEPVWTWNGFNGATAKFTCANNNAHVENISATVTNVITTAATCTTDGLKTYTATVTFGGKNYTDTKTETLTKLGHSFTNYISDNNATCAADGTKTATCDRCDATDTITDEGSQLPHASWTDNVCDECGYDAGGSKSLNIVLNEETNTYSLNGIGACTDTELEIPATYNGLPVIAIDNRAFMNNPAITSVTIPDSVTTIGEGAFYGCYSLESVMLGENSQLTTITMGAFYQCSSLKNITIPDNVTTINEYTFYGCRSLTGITIPVGVTSIRESAFDHCDKLFEVWDLTGNDGEGALNITAGSSDNGYVGYYALNVYTSEEESSKLTIDENGYIIYDYGTDKYLVGYNGEQTQLILPDDITEIYNYAFSGCSSLTSVTIPDSVTSIGNSAFSYCYSLTSITIPDSVTSIGNGAFNCCFNLNDVYITDMTAWCSISFGDLYANPLYCTKNLYLNDQPVTELTIPDGITSIGNYVFIGFSSVTSITIPDSVTSIGVYAFYYCTSLANIEILNGVTTINDYTFYGCTSLTSITIPDGVTSIGEGAFQGCTSLESVTFGKNSELTTINVNAFYGCTSLTSLSIPDSVTIIGGKAFYGCSSLASVTFGNSVTSIGDAAFEDCTSLASVTFPDSVTSIGANAFFYCSSLESVTFGANSELRTINADAFNSCVALKSISIPDSVTHLGELAFYNCGMLESVIKIGDGVTSIGAMTFQNCTSIKNVIIGNAVTSIGGNAFINCSSLESLTIGNSVTIIGDSAFYGCNALISVVIPDSVTTIEKQAFSSCDSLATVIIGSGVTSIRANAFRYCEGLTNVYYKGTADKWSEISIDGSNSCLTDTTIYYFSESEPALNEEETAYDGNFWHYVDGEIVVWIKETV